MSITQTALVFAGIPAAVIAVVYAIVFGTAGRHGSKRYRPGRPFTFTPVWFLASPARATGEPVGVGALPPGQTHRELATVPAGDPVLAGAAQPAVQHGETGGASDNW